MEGIKQNLSEAVGDQNKQFSGGKSQERWYTLTRKTMWVTKRL